MVRERERKRGDLKHLSIHQWIRSAIPDSQPSTSRIGFLFLKLPPPPCAVLGIWKNYWARQKFSAWVTPLDQAKLYAWAIALNLDPNLTWPILTSGPGGSKLAKRRWTMGSVECNGSESKPQYRGEHENSWQRNLLFPNKCEVLNMFEPSP